MRISRIQTFLCDAGWRPWTFVKVETDDGLVGWGECSDTRNPHGVAGCVRDFEELLVGEDPRAVERLYWDLLRASRQNLGGISHKAIAGIELALHAMDTAIIDVPWNGFGQAYIIGQMADAYELTVAPHNYYSHLADLHAIHLCAVLPNVRIMEIDIDDVPWKRDLVTVPPTIQDGCIVLPTGPGWGADVNEVVLREHPWQPTARRVGY
jgi:L-alanine-DL-glutamate epimerase-like enolase superfamily enzyme